MVSVTHVNASGDLAHNHRFEIDTHSPCVASRILLMPFLIGISRHEVLLYRWQVVQPAMASGHAQVLERSVDAGPIEAHEAVALELG